MKAITRLLVSILISLSITASFAGNYSFLDNSPTSLFEGKDNDILLANAMKALNKGKDGKKYSWKNPATGAMGFAIPSHTTKKNGLLCRTLTMHNTARGVDGEATYQFCKIKGEWKYTTSN